ncbi:MBL fold metallo-hydrolase (plasmid) [Polymorphobacter sp. PAMC 29334]|uniref:MBL fold metallo-hydrolase n=1 Tax=Polymorphobacter sp. PAMC 29334 TaxID=2862331 RepID=UPI001C682AAA|nr:MBL fold metallo-hydrolase [Polymorphobacter sp. PAMC 29334]QYE33309.1 MBL fold metallo-hydrolase [Polymorphobacter sp. PAMC 29334]
MHRSLVTRCTGTKPSAQSRYAGLASITLIAIALITAPAWGGGKLTPYDLINKAAESSPITVHQLRGGVSMLEGSGGNIGVLEQPGGVLMVDAGIAVSEARIKAALQDLGPAPLKTVILTHWHWDHSDGDAWVRRAGATLIADPRAIQRLRETNRIVEWGHTFTPISAESLPNEAVAGDRSLPFGTETALIRHYGAGHTDGDLSVYFKRADILQTGDTFWNGVYPFIDYVTGGSIDGAVDAANENLRLARQTSVIIPGHGPVGNYKSLVAFRDMLVNVRAKVAKLKARGMSLKDVQRARPTASLDAVWGQSVIDGELFTALVYRGVAMPKPKPNR